MKSHIVISKKIYEKYKDDILPLNARLFTEHFFYDLINYEVPLDLKGIESFLSYVEEIHIYTTSTFLDFINILLVLSFLKSKEYKGKIIVSYYSINTNRLSNALLGKSIICKNEYDDVDELLKKIKNNECITSTNIKLLGIINYINFYNMINDGEKFMLSIEEIIDEYDENIDSIATYLCDNYSNMGLSKEFYLNYLVKYLGE